MSKSNIFPFRGGRDLSQYREALPVGTRLRMTWDDYAVFEGVVMPNSPGAYPTEMCMCVTKIIKQLKWGLHIKMAPKDIYKHEAAYELYPVYYIAGDIEVMGRVTRKVGKFIAE